MARTSTCSPSSCTTGPTTSATSCCAPCAPRPAPDARGLVIEQVLPDDGPGDPGPALYDLHMLVGTGGRERTRTEYAQLLAGAGFRVESVIPTAGPRSVIDARPVPHGAARHSPRCT
ncbi:methyltransferase [Pseudonocardia sp. NPDC049635]|uniref:methyltransferase n=1 Tax=Pseudonocardia sp. NPDC049635 TaxID=3155506 RepID=UPI00340A3357